MRCPDCNKFTGLETQEPELNTIESTYSNETFTITADGRTVRQCADCGTELKALDWQQEMYVDLDRLFECEAGKALSPEQVEYVKKALEEETANVHIEDTGTEQEESGGSRHKKNIITSCVNFEITVTVHDVPGMDKDLELVYADQVRSENAASEFEEQV